jgi:hypothetical protein
LENKGKQTRIQKQKQQKTTPGLASAAVDIDIASWPGGVSKRNKPPLLTWSL